MKKIICLAVFVLMISMSVFSQTDESNKSDSAFYSAANKWFSAWKLVSRDIYRVKNFKPVEFVFFDEKYVYSTSGISVPNGEIVKGSQLFNVSQIWKRTVHNGSLTLPDKAVVPVGLMSFAGEIKGTNKAFFVMPLPSFWKKAEVKSEELGLDKLVTGVFIHEFSHSQQMQNFGKKMTEYEKATDFGTEFNDDIVQNLFEKDSSYTKLFKQEVTTFYQAANEKNKNAKAKLINEALKLLRQRHDNFFVDKYKNLREIDELFLTMEGLGQYSMYLWLINPKGGNLDKTIAVKGVRRNQHWWSQDEGFVLFLNLEQFSPPQKWAAKMFGNKVESVVSLIDKKVK